MEPKRLSKRKRVHNYDSESSTDTDLPPLVGRQREEESNDDNTSNGSYVYHTDNDDSSIESSDDEGSSTVPGVQERHRSGRSSDEVPQSIDTNSIEPPWKYATVDEDDYDADHDNDAVSTKTRGTIAPLRMRGGGTPVVETVIEEDTEEGLKDQEQPQPQPTQNPLIPTTTKKNTTTTKPEV